MYSRKGIKQIIIKVENSSKTITLSDRSKWKAVGIYSHKLLLWLPTHKAIIKGVGLNYKITNISKDETIDAEYID